MDQPIGVLDVIDSIGLFHRQWVIIIEFGSEYRLKGRGGVRCIHTIGGKGVAMGITQPQPINHQPQSYTLEVD